MMPSVMNSKSNRSNVIKIILPSLVLSILFLILLYSLKLKLEKIININLQNINLLEKEYITKLPIYSDYITPQIEQELRKYLLPYHLQVAKNESNFFISNPQELQIKIKEKELEDINTEEVSSYLFFYNVPQHHRYLTPKSKQGLIQLGNHFQNLLKEKGVYPKVKFALSSAVRPSDYQNNLIKKNNNASIVSTHSYGRSFDIFYDEYFVSLNEEVDISKKSLLYNFFTLLDTKLKRKIGFLLGQSLRRQFQSILTETVLQLQEEGLIYVILEKTQRCYHVTIR